MLDQMTLWDLPSATSSPESADGVSPSDLPDGRTTDPSGPDHHRANPFPSRVSKKESQMIDIWRRSGSSWSEPGGLLSSLANRLQQQSKKMPGLMIYSMYWKPKITPRGRWYYQLVASDRRTSASELCSQLKGWPTPNATDEKWRYSNTEMALRRLQSGKQMSLEATAHLGGWVTPSTRDWKDTPGMATTGTNPDGSKRSRLDQLPRQAGLAGWPTTTKMDANSSRRHDYMKKGKPGTTMTDAVNLSGWPAPSTDNFRSRGWHRKQEMGPQQLCQKIDQPIRVTGSGQILTGSDAGMESSGQLDPAHSRWLMGFPPEWDAYAPTVTR